MPQHLILIHYPVGPVKVQANAFLNGQTVTNWLGTIWVDKPLAKSCSNQDPFVFNNPWLYSYCKITVDGLYNKLSSGSHIFFINNELMKDGIFSVDTVFVVDSQLSWAIRNTKVPTKYAAHQCNTNSDLWDSHFKFGIEHCECKTIFEHAGFVTFESKLFKDNEKGDYSFLPYKNNKQLKIDFQFLPTRIKDELTRRIPHKIKHHLFLTETERIQILDLINKNCDLKVLSDIKLIK